VLTYTSAFDKIEDDDDARLEYFGAPMESNDAPMFDATPFTDEDAKLLSDLESVKETDEEDTNDVVESNEIEETPNYDIMTQEFEEDENAEKNSPIFVNRRRYGRQPFGSIQRRRNASRFQFVNRRRYGRQPVGSIQRRRNASRFQRI